MLAQLIVAMAMTQSAGTGMTSIEGLILATFVQPQGNIHVYLPEDMTAGDTISGTVIAAPAGNNESDRSKNFSVLSGVVLDIAGNDVPVKDGRFTIEIPEDVNIIELSDGRTDLTHIPEPSDWHTSPISMSAPAVSQARKPLVLTGPFDGNMTNSGVTIDGTAAPVLAESPRSCVVASPSQPSSQALVEVKENGETSELSVRYIQIELTSPKTTLQIGQRTEIEMIVKGLENLSEPITIRLTNRSPETVSLIGGEVQEFEITDDKVQIGGICGFALGLMAKAPGGYVLGAEIVPAANKEDPPDGFKWDPERPDVLIPDDTELKEGDKIKPKQFEPNGEKKGNTGGDGNWQESDEPESKDLGDVRVWYKHIDSVSYNKNEYIYRGGQFPIHFKYTGTECLPGKWRQIVRSTLYVGDSVDSLKPAHLDDGRYVPHPDGDHKGDWAIDTNQAGRDAKNPDYPNQDKGEMLDTPSRSKRSFAGYYSQREPEIVKARVIREEVEFYTFWIGPGGEICKIIKWGFVTTWEVKDGDNPSTEDAKNHAKVSSTFTDPVSVDGNSAEGKSAKEAYEKAMEPFK